VGFSIENSISEYNVDLGHNIEPEDDDNLSGIALAVN
jgi:hypothetical protein